MTESIVKLPIERVESVILLIRGEKVILDAQLLECGGKRSATPLWICTNKAESKAPSTLRSAGALHRAADSSQPGAIP